MLLKDRCHAKAMATIQSHKANAINESAIKRERIFSLCPEAKNLTEQIERTMNVLFYDIIDNTDHFDECRKTVSELRESRKIALKKYGFDESSLEIQYFCPICKDTGAIEDRLCTCYKKALSEEYLNVSNMAGKKIGFKDFNSSYYPKDDLEQINQFLSFCKDYVSRFDEINSNLLLYGTPGSGKTFLSCAIGCELINAGKFVIYTPVQDMITAYENARFSKDPENPSDTDIYNYCDLLIIDDLGAEFKTQFAESVIYNILNNRINAKKPFIVSTNLTHGEIEERYNERIASRLSYEALSFVFPNVDIRLKRRQKHE